MKAIPTTYAGVEFRSKLEAKWALFFDCLGIVWEYEDEGYELEDGTKYLPDFWLPKFSGGVFVEVKPPDDPFVKSRRLAREAKRPIWLCDGPPIWRTWTVLERNVGEDEDGVASFEVIEWQAIPLIERAWKEHRFWWNPATFTETEAAELYPHLFAAFAKVRSYRFWDPKPRKAA